MGWNPKPRPYRNGFRFVLRGQYIWRKRKADAWLELERLKREAGLPEVDRSSPTQINCQSI